MKKLNRIICVLLALSFCFGALCCMSACVEEEGDSNLFYVNYKDIRIELGKNAEDVLEKLGEPKDRVNHGNCGGIGVQTEYVYSDISLYTIKQSDGEIIHKIFFKNDFVSTPKGIYIGSSVNAVRDAYGDPSSENGGKLIYKKGNFELEIEIENSKVSDIRYTRIVNA